MMKYQNVIRIILATTLIALRCNTSGPIDCCMSSTLQGFFGLSSTPGNAPFPQAVLPGKGLKRSGSKWNKQQKTPQHQKNNNKKPHKNKQQKKIAEKWPDSGWNRVNFLHSTKYGAVDGIGFVFALEKELVIQGCISYCWAVLKESQPFLLLILPHQAGGAQGAGTGHNKLALCFVELNADALAHHSSLYRTVYRSFLPSSRSTFLPILMSSENWLRIGSFLHVVFFTQIQSEALGDHKLSKDKLQHYGLVFSVCYKLASNQPKFLPVSMTVSMCTSVCRKRIH